MNSETELLIRLFHHRWAAPILAYLDERDGCRFVELVNVLGVSRDRLSVTLAALIDRGLVMRNPGYGHALRPEYILTPEGRRLAPACARFIEAARQERVEDVLLLKWSAGVLHGINAGHARFNDLKAALDGISPRALSGALRNLEEPHLVRRAESGAAVVYSVAAKGLRLVPAIGELAAAG